MLVGPSIAVRSTRTFRAVASASIGCASEQDREHRSSKISPLNSSLALSISMLVVRTFRGIPERK